jgi:hypothetical protein
VLNNVDEEAVYCWRVLRKTGKVDRKQQVARKVGGNISTRTDWYPIFPSRQGQ